MKNNNFEKRHPLTHLSDQELDQLISDLEIPYTEKNKQNILKKTNRKTHKNKFQLLRKRTQILLAVAASLLIIPSTVFAAHIIWEIFTQQDGFLTTLRFETEQINNTPYKVKLDYIPENLEQFQDLKYHEKERKTGGFSLLLIKPAKKNSFEIPYSTSNEEIKIGDHLAYSIQRVGNYQTLTTVSYLFFEKEQRVVNVYFDSTIDSTEQIKILEGISLEKTDKSHASPFYDMSQNTQSDSWIEKPLKLDSPRIHKIGDTFSATYESKKDAVKIKASKLETYDYVPNYPEKSEDYIDDINELASNNLLSSDGKLHAFEGDIFQKSDNKKELDQYITTLTIQPLYLQFTIEITNQTETDFDNFYFAPTLVNMDKLKTGYIHNMGQTYTTPILLPETLVYNSAHGKGKSYNNTGKLQAGETKTITIGYLTTDPAITNQLLEINLDGVGKEDLNSHDFSWIQFN